MNALPEPRPTLTDGQRQVSPETQKILDEIETVYSKPVPTSVRVGLVAHHAPAPPVAQPGHPPMSPRATEIGRLALYLGCATVPPGLVASLFMVATEHADPTVIAWCAAVPAGVAIPILAAARLLRTAGERKAEHHHHYEGTVYQQTTHTSTRGVWACTNNRQ